MEQTRPAGALRISHETYRHVRGVFDVEPQPPIEVKGITEPVRSYLVTRAKPRAFRMANRGLEGIDTPDGRPRRRAGADRRRCSRARARTTACTQATIVGEPGIGKSRLGLEFTHWLELQRRSRCASSRAGRSPYGNNIPYGLLRDLLAWRFEILESDPQSVAQAKLVAGLGAVLGDRAAEHTAADRRS